MIPHIGRGFATHWHDRPQTTRERDDSVLSHQRQYAALLAGALALTIALAAGLPASAKPSPQPDPTAFTDSAVIYGGKTQSTDPTRYDYVAPVADDGPTVTPQSATGIGWISAFSYSWNGLTIPVPATYLQHTINGSGLRIDSEYADYLYGSPFGLKVCNYRTSFQNRYGDTIYSTRWAPLHTGCSYVTFSQSIRGPFTVKTGVQCARYYVNGTFRGEQCHSVFA